MEKKETEKLKKQDKNKLKKKKELAKAKDRYFAYYDDVKHHSRGKEDW